MEIIDQMYKEWIPPRFHTPGLTPPTPSPGATYWLPCVSAASPPDFARRPVKKSTVIQRGGEVALECRPHASPRAALSWWKEGKLLRDGGRYVAPPAGTDRSVRLLLAIFSCVVLLLSQVVLTFFIVWRKS